MPYNPETHTQFARRIVRNIVATNVALLLTSMLAFYAVWQVGDLSRATISVHERDRLLVQELRMEVERSVSLNRALLLTGDPQLIRDIETVEQAFFTHAEELHNRMESPLGKQLLAQAIEEKREHSEAVSNVVQHWAPSAATSEIAQAFRTKIQPRTQALQSALADLLEHKSELLNQVADQTLRVANTAWWILLFLAIANIVLGITIAWTTRRTLYALKRYANGLSQSIHARDEFIAVASHELRTPLSVLKLQTEMLDRRIKKGDVDGDIAPYLQTFSARVNRGVHSLNMLVTRMLDIANIHRGQLVLSKEQINLSELVNECAEQLRPLLAESGCDVQLHANEPVVGYWDKSRVEQIVQNLLMNVARHAPGKAADIHVNQQGGRAMLIVEDQGPGVAEADRKRIFERFERAHYSGDGTGMGLGLAVSREFAKAHGGDLWIEPLGEEGSRFVLELPNRQPQ